MYKNYTPLEKDEQISFINYCSLLNIRVISTQNGFKSPFEDKRKYLYINSLKRAGLSAGFPDLIVFAKNSKSNILLIEMKRKKGGKLRPEQKEWIDWLDKNDYYVGVAYGCEGAINILNQYLKI